MSSNHEPGVPQEAPHPPPQPADEASLTRCAVRGDLPVRRVGGQVHVMTPDGRIHTLDNPSAVAVWEALERAGSRGLDAQGAAEALVARFDVAPREALRDASAFLGALARAGLAAPLSGHGGAQPAAPHVD